MTNNYGYSWENEVVKYFKEKGFNAVRLGGTTLIMPDISINKTSTKTVMAIKCKSTTTNHCVIPLEQIQRCINWVNSWDLYTSKMVLFAFKFSAKYEYGEKKEFFKIWNLKMKPVDFSCNYQGFCKVQKSSKDLWLEDFFWS